MIKYFQDYLSRIKFKGKILMIFNSMIFLWIFLPIILVLYYIVPNKLKNLFLMLISLVVYAWGSLESLTVLLTSIVVNYFIGILINAQKKNRLKKNFFGAGMLFNIGILCYYKYSNFFISTACKILGNTTFNMIDILIPVGISYFTFSSMSYLFDIYRQEAKVQKNPINLALYISFFPKVIMGPIESYKDFEVFINKKDLSIDNMADGIKRFVYGLSKKVIIANSMAVIADTIFDSDISMITTRIAWIGSLCYMIQIYYDFSGYSDMAIGLSKMLGFNLKENFDLPYNSQSITEFWRRWHISLSTWFKNYLYIPLGGNRKGNFRTYLNLFIVFLVTGLWHGASWNFIVWGIYNGLFMVVERIFLKKILDRNKFKIINHIYTLLVVITSWVYFRISDINKAVEYVRIMFTKTTLLPEKMVYLSNVLTTSNLIIFVIGIIFAGIVPALYRKTSKLKNIYEVFIEPIIIVTLFLMSIMYIVNGTYNSFIYMNF